jgi:chromate reductase
MKTILAIGGSSSKQSINKKLAGYTANQVENATVVILDLNDFEMPVFSVDVEAESGSPEAAGRFRDHINAADGIVLSLAEHNGSYSAAFKNVVDWTSRIQGKVWGEKPMFLMATSPGGRGGQTVLASATVGYPHLGANVVSNFSLPSFNDNFSEEGIKNEELSAEFNQQLETFVSSL